MTYRQEYYAGEAEDEARVLSLDEQAGVPFGHFTDVLMTKEVNPLEPRHGEYKFYARGVGPVLELTASGGTDRVSLLKVGEGASRSAPRDRAPPRSPRRDRESSSATPGGSSTCSSPERSMLSERVPGRHSSTCPPRAAVGGDEVQVIAVDLEPLGVVGEPEADHGAGDVAELEHALFVDDLAQRPVRGQLARDRAGADELELAVDADRAARVGVGGDEVELGEHLRERHRARRASAPATARTRRRRRTGSARWTRSPPHPRRDRRGRSARRGRSSRRRARSGSRARGRRARPARRR